MSLLEVKDLRTQFIIEEQVIKAVDGVSFCLDKQEILGLVGESGCGKSMTALSVLRLIPNPGKIVSGEILFNGKNLLAFSKESMRNIRGQKISIIFQDPSRALNGVYSVKSHLFEALERQNLSKKFRRKRAVELLDMVGIPEAEKRIEEYPHQFSGGMQQRVMIAIALACNPEILIADEPTTALDVTIQAGILELISDIQKELGLSVILITHNLGVVARYSQRIAIMYAGRIVEEGTTEEIFENQLHPYTEKLLASVPRVDKGFQELREIPGKVPSLADLPRGCKFYPRCQYRCDRGEEKEPNLGIVEGNRMVRCWRYENESS